MKLMLDEMISPRVARELRDRGFDVQAVKGDRPELISTPDIEVVRRIRDEQRAIVTNNVGDFQPIHDQFMSRDEEHYGMLFTWDASLPRNKAKIALWVETLEAALKDNPGDDALRNRVKHLP